MTSNSTPSPLDLDSAIALKQDSLSETSETQQSESPPVEEVVSKSSESWLAIPEPDADNITVLTHNLPNKPILPWNRYDSPWEKSETEESTESEAEAAHNSEAVLPTDLEDEKPEAIAATENEPSQQT